MPDAEFNYEASELRKVCPSGDYRIKITSNKGDTRWMSISAEKMAKIADVLIG